MLYSTREIILLLLFLIIVVIILISSTIFVLSSFHCSLSYSPLFFFPLSSSLSPFPLLSLPSLSFFLSFSFSLSLSFSLSPLSLFLSFSLSLSFSFSLFLFFSFSLFLFFSLSLFLFFSFSLFLSFSLSLFLSFSLSLFLSSSLSLFLSSSLPLFIFFSFSLSLLSLFLSFSLSLFLLPTEVCLDLHKRVKTGNYCMKCGIDNFSPSLPPSLPGRDVFGEVVKGWWWWWWWWWRWRWCLFLFVPIAFYLLLEYPNNFLSLTLPFFFLSPSPPLSPSLPLSLSPSPPLFPPLPPTPHTGSSSNEVLQCPNCNRPVTSVRFVPHLEKCLGLGRASSHRATRRIAAMRVDPGRDEVGRGGGGGGRRGEGGMGKKEKEMRKEGGNFGVLAVM